MFCGKLDVKVVQLEKQIDRLEEDCNGYKRNDRCKL